MNAEKRDEFESLMKELMVLQGDLADLNKRFYELWKKVDDKLNGEDKQ